MRNVYQRRDKWILHMYILDGGTYETCDLRCDTYLTEQVRIGLLYRSSNL